MEKEVKNSELVTASIAWLESEGNKKRWLREEIWKKEDVPIVLKLS